MTMKMKGPVVVADRIDDNPSTLMRLIHKAIKQTGMESDLHGAQTIFIKPNLTYPKYKRGVTTRVEMVRSLVKALLDYNDKLRVLIGEGEGGYNSFSMDQAFKNMGFFKLEEDFHQVEIVNLSKIPSKIITIDTPKGSYGVELPEIFFNEIDFSISCPLPKVHCMTKVTLSYKNQWGCLPDVMRLKNHFMFNHIISKISDILKFKYAFLDGKFGLTTNGPMVGDPINVNWFVASNSLGAFDMIIAEMMDFDWKTVEHLKMAAEYGFIPKREDIAIIGDIKSLKRKFVLKRNIWNYPALAGFHSSRLTHLFYFSKWAKLLHDVMYTFRKRPIS